MSVNGGRGRAPRPIWLIAGGAAVLAGVVGLLSGQPNGWAVVLVAVGVLLPVAALLADKAAARSGDLDIEKAADRLANLVYDQWDKEATRRGVGRPPLEVFWQAADADLVYTWPELLAQAAVGRSGPASAAPGSGRDDLAGNGALLTAYDRSPCGRLVVLGEPGAGKTILLLRFVLDALARRQPGQPVPLLVPLASWNPDGPSLYSWLEGQILREYPHLAAVDSSTGRKRAGALLDAGLILPVLDGLDEIRAGGRDKAMRAINDGLRSNIGVVLSCRPAEFRTAVQQRPDLRPIHLNGAAAIRLTPLTTTAVRDYLLAGAGADGPARWAQALTALANPASPVAQALATPLAAFLAGTIYNPHPGETTLGLPNPTDLTALPTAAAVEQHLLAGFIPAAYRPHPDQSTRWTAEQATGYLTFLARHLEHRLHTTSLAWWELDRAAPRILPAIAFGPPAGLATGVTFGPASGLAFGVAVGLTGGHADGFGPDAARDIQREPTPRIFLAGNRTKTLVAALIISLVIALAASFTIGPAGGLACGLVAGLALVGRGSAWARLGLARLWLAARRQQPLRLIAFLEDAHARGVLRQAGAVWEFRHANLQRYLAGPP
ncbi:NACHT domain-containing protein [Frankia sp. Cpl3]|nr:NACHT domain-containing protein [Frankia sp. Cpl3]